jgi:hypothetical protein
MAGTDRVTVTLPNGLIEHIDRVEKERHRREELHRSLHYPHLKTAEFVDRGLEEWIRALPDEDVGELVDNSRGKPIQWVAGEGWLADRSEDQRARNDR